MRERFGVDGQLGSHELMVTKKYPVLFLDDSTPIISASNKDNDHQDYELPGLTDVRRWRLQNLLAIHVWGIPSLALAETYERMFSLTMDLNDWGFEDLSDMIHQLNGDIFTVQEPDEVTALMFPDYASDLILHDARYGHCFQSQEPCGAQMELLKANLVEQDHEDPGAKEETDMDQTGSKKLADPDTLISYAWLNRDECLPRDVVLAGEQYSEFILPMTAGQIADTNGVHQLIIVGAASPSHIYVNIKSETLDRLDRLGVDVAEYFDKCPDPLEMYSLPQEFIYPGFACLVYLDDQQTWERCTIIERSPKGRKVLVETVDFGGTRIVNQINLYLMPRQFFDLPRQGLLVSLLGLKPVALVTSSSSSGGGGGGTPVDQLAEVGPFMGSNGGKWPATVGRRVRHFSLPHYFLDCVLRRIEPLKSASARGGERSSASRSEPMSDTRSESGSVDLVQSDQTHGRKRRSWPLKYRQVPQYEIIACDRNDPYLDIHLDEILTMETYAQYDDQRLDKLTLIKREFKQVLSTISRPINPYY